MDGENGKPRNGLRESEVALDLTRLKNWSNFEETAYRDFSQQRAERRGIAHRRLDENRRIAAAEMEAALETVLEPVSAPAGATPISGATPIFGATPIAGEALVLDEAPRSPVFRAAPTVPATLAAAASPASSVSASSVPASSVSASSVSLVPPVHAVVRDAGDAAMVAKMAPAYAAAAGAGARTARVVVAVYSLTGGVGKSTICAHLARTLYGSGEQVLLVDPSGRAMLPAFFGSHEERDGLRKFCAPGETHASVLVATREGGDVAWLREEVGPLMAAVDRTIVDLGGAAPAVVEEVLTIAQLLLIPVVPGPQAAATVGRVTAWLEKLRARGAHSPRVYYLMNRVDEQRESDRRTVEGMREICGEALAPVALAESEEVEYAFAERMTVSDFHTTAPLALQYEKLASWMRKLLPPSTPPPARRWSEV